MRQLSTLALLAVVVFIAATLLAHDVVHPLDGVNLLQLNDDEFIYWKSRIDSVFVNVKVVENAVLTTQYMKDFKIFLFGDKFGTLDTIAGTGNRVFRTMLSLKRIQAISHSFRYSDLVEYIERVPSNQRLTFPSLSMDSLKYSKLRVELHPDVRSEDLSKILAVNVQKRYALKLKDRLWRLSTSTNFLSARKSFQNQIRQPFDITDIEREFSVSILSVDAGLVFVSLENFNSNAWTIFQHESIPEDSYTQFTLNQLYQRQKLEKELLHSSSMLSFWNDISTSMGESLLSILLKEESIMSVSREFPQTTLNYGTNIVIQSKGEESRYAWNNNVTGTGQIVHLIDSGIDYEHCYFYRSGESYFTSARPNNRKIVFYEVGKFGDRVDRAGHGTQYVFNIFHNNM